MIYAQLYYISEEGNHYPQTDRLPIHSSLEGLLTVSTEHEGNNAYWVYYHQTQRQADLTGGLHITDFNKPI